ncbi:MAG: domain proteinfibronectin type protein [Bacteroidota bacterium]|nr:domain proteinfibronectin type protein [Bacteroidota bacterium]
MKKQFLFFAGLFLLVNVANAQCTIDPRAQTSPGISPTADNLPCVVTNTPYNQVIQVQNLSGLGPGGAITVDSMQLSSVSGLPTGITWESNPLTLAGGQNGCLTFSGVTTSPTGQYTLGWIGTVWFTAPLLGKQMYTGDLTRFGGAPFKYYLQVINPSDPCIHAVSINDVSSDLNAAISVYPNPNNGVFEFKMDAAKRVNGEMVIIDMTGRILYTEKLDVAGIYNTSIDLSKFAKGLYTLQLRTADGFASKNISIQ